MIEAPPVVERLTRVTPLGLRFWDAATRQAVTEGLVVTAYPAPAGSLPTPSPRPQTPGREATVTPAGVYVFQHLPGLGAAERGAGDADFWHDPPVTRSFTIEVVDLLGRFQAVSFGAT